jgi:2-iminoacetate synthase ThiH
MEKLQKQIHHFHAVILSYFSSCPAISIRLRYRTPPLAGHTLVQVISCSPPRAA